MCNTKLQNVLQNTFGAPETLPGIASPILLDEFGGPTWLRVPTLEYFFPSQVSAKFSADFSLSPYKATAY